MGGAVRRKGGRGGGGVCVLSVRKVGLEGYPTSFDADESQETAVASKLPQNRSRANDHERVSNQASHSLVEAKLMGAHGARM